MKYTIEMKFVMDDKEHTTEALEEMLKTFLDETNGAGYAKVTCEDGRVVEVKK